MTYDQKEHILDEMNDRFRSGERIETGVDQVLSLWQEKRLISHWGLRDELKALYPDPAGRPKQELILRVMRHIIQGTIPQEAINNNVRGYVLTFL